MAVVIRVEREDGMGPYKEETGTKDAHYSYRVRNRYQPAPWSDFYGRPGWLNAHRSDTRYGFPSVWALCRWWPMRHRQFLARDARPRLRLAIYVDAEGVCVSPRQAIFTGGRVADRFPLDVPLEALRAALAVALAADCDGRMVPVSPYTAEARRERARAKKELVRVERFRASFVAPDNSPWAFRQVAV